MRFGGDSLRTMHTYFCILFQVSSLEDPKDIFFIKFEQVCEKGERTGDTKYWINYEQNLPHTAQFWSYVLVIDYIRQNLCIQSISCDTMTAILNGV